MGYITYAPRVGTVPRAVLLPRLPLVGAAPRAALAASKVGLALRANLVCLELCCGPRPLVPATYPSRSPAPPFCSYPLQIRPPYSVIFPASASPTSCLQLLYSVIFPASTFAPLHRSSAPICTFAPASPPSSVLCNPFCAHLSTFAQELCSVLHFYTASCLPPLAPYLAFSNDRSASSFSVGIRVR
jgi:hypothetical protein